MSGHSKWAKIKRAKAANDTKRGAIFTKLGKNITLSAREGGGDPDMNFSLRLAIDKAKEANMPQDNIERAIKKGTGELKGGQIERITYEAITASGVGVLIDCATDNTNRSFAEVKNIVEKNGAKMAEAGSVSWQFKEFGEIEVGAAKLKKAEKYGEEDSFENASLDDLEMDLLEIEGVLDYEVVDPTDDKDFEETDERPQSRKYVFVTTEKQFLQKVAEEFKNKGWQVLSSDIVKNAENKVSLSDEDQEKLENFIEVVEDHDDVNTVWHNAE